MTFFVNPFPQSFDINGDPTAQYNAFFGEPNQDPKLFPKAPFSDAALTVPLPTTILLDNRGSYGQDIFLDGEYSLRIEDTLGALYRESPSIAGILTEVEQTDEQVGGNSITAHQALVCSNTTAQLSEVDIAADAVTLRDSSNFSIRVNNVSVTIDIEVSGENGLDAGSEAADTWYHFFVIFNPTTSTTAGLFSLSPTVPALPIGFTFFGLVGAVYNETDSDFRDFIQTGNLAVGEIVSVLVNGNATGGTAIDLSVAIPPTAKKALVLLDATETSAFGVPESVTIFPDAMFDFTAAIISFTAFTNNESMGYATTLQIHVSQTTFYQSSDLFLELDMDVTGWEF